MSQEARTRSQLAWSSGHYTDEELGRLTLVYRELTVKGKTQQAIQLEDAMARAVPYAELELPENEEVAQKRKSIRPESGIDVMLVDIPPAAGKGSSQKTWAQFASLVSEMDEEVIDQFSRDELIGILVDRDIIDDPRAAKSS